MAGPPVPTDIPDHHRASVTGAKVGPGLLVDIGAGTCVLERFAPGGYIAVDVAADLLVPGPGRLVAQVTELPLADGVADTTACISVLQYVLDVRAALTELRRVTRPGGTVLVLVPNIRYLRDLVTLARGRFPWSSDLDDWSGGTIRYFTRADLTDLAHEVGFVVRDVTCSGRFHGLRSKAPSLFGADLLFDLENPA